MHPILAPKFRIASTLVKWSELLILAETLSKPSYIVVTGQVTTHNTCILLPGEGYTNSYTGCNSGSSGPCMVQNLDPMITKLK